LIYQNGAQRYRAQNNMTTTNITPKVSEIYEVGAILTDSWGYDQTNIDFYCIVKVSGSFVTLLPMKKISTNESSYMSRENMPGEIDFNEKPIRKKVKNWNGAAQGFSLRNYAGGGWCRLWNGKPETSTHYA
jgi:hypothetical protein